MAGLKYRVGDLIEAAKRKEVSVIAHGCNCFCTMQSGIAPLIAVAFPVAKEADLKTEKGDASKLGGISVGHDHTFGVTVFNLYSQFGYWGRREGKMDLNYSALRSALARMRSSVHHQGLFEKPVGIPLIGAGLAGGNWNLISRIITEELGTLPNLTVYVLDKKYIPKGVK